MRRLTTALPVLGTAAAVVWAVAASGDGQALRPAATVAPSAYASASLAGEPPRWVPPPARPRPPPTIPRASAIQEAEAFARRRSGLVSLAVVDTEGRLHGLEQNRRFVSASVVKALLMAAELRRMARSGERLDPATESMLRAMITVSDNDAADAAYGRVGDAGLREVARAAGMRRYAVAGHWANSQITAADMAAFFARLHGAMPRRFRPFALGLLGSIVPEQSWGIPAVAPPRWAVRFKGGWRDTELGWLAHQAAELRDGDRVLSIAVLTDGQPSHAYAVETISGIATRLLDPTEPRSRAERRTPERSPRAPLRAPRRSR